MSTFIRFAGLEGNVQTTTGHTEWTEVNSLTWGVGRAQNVGIATSSAASWVPTEIGATKRIDSSSPVLFQHYRLGTKLLVSIVSGKHPSEGPVYHTIDLTNATVARILRISDGTNAREKIVIRFAGYTYNGIPNIHFPHHLFDA